MGVYDNSPDFFNDVVDNVENDTDVGRVGDGYGGFTKCRVGRRRILDLHVQQLNENGDGAQPNEQERVTTSIFRLKQQENKEIKVTIVDDNILRE